MDAVNILEKIIHLLFSDEELTVPQIQVKLGINFGIHIKQQQIVKIINNNRNDFVVIPEGKKRKIRYSPGRRRPSLDFIEKE